ncbi:hypothetical protein B0H19DRAFT_1064502 [Mycena capillaripes]|nr:hypothetical protein B0H19DRAFT_1064502 [Mycena capillaripes]
MLHEGQDINLIWATARALRYLRLDCRYAIIFSENSYTNSRSLALDFTHLVPHWHFPPLPSLHSLKVFLHFSDRNAPWFFDTISDILASDSQSRSPSIKELIVTYSSIAANGAAMERPQSLVSWSLNALGNSVLTHRASPRVRWRVGFMQAYREDDLPKFTAVIRHAMPQLDKLGKLVLEHFELN